VGGDRAKVEAMQCVWAATRQCNGEGYKVGGDQTEGQGQGQGKVRCDQALAAPQKGSGTLSLPSPGPPDASCGPSALEGVPHRTHE